MNNCSHLSCWASLDVDINNEYKGYLQAMKTRTLSRLFSGVFCVALFMAPCSGALAQNLFVADYSAMGTIFEISPSGTLSMFASGLTYPAGLAFDKAGDLFEADWGSGNIYEFINEDGVLNSNPVLFASGFALPGALAFDQMGNLFVAETAIGNIDKIAPDGTQSIFATGVFFSWCGLAVSSKDEAFVEGQYSTQIYKFTPVGDESAFGSTQATWGTTALTFGKTGELYAANYNTDEIMIVRPGHQKVFTSAINPWGLVFDESGNLYVADGRYGDVMKITPKGNQMTLAFGLDDPIAMAIQPLAPKAQKH